MSGMNANQELALQDPAQVDEIAEAARKLIELGTLLADKSRTLREALTELTAPSPSHDKPKDRLRMRAKQRGRHNSSVM